MAQSDQSRVPESLRKQLSLAVRSLQWSYAIFWSISATQPGILKWGDGYYNGDIKTRKTIRAVEIKADELGLQRSEQLKELYDSLAAGEPSPQSKRPSASLSPEDLSDTEWYYLVCMSFVFDIGEGLPGRTLVTGKPIWLCNASHAYSKVFSRSLLAKGVTLGAVPRSGPQSASIQTIVCFPFCGGVIEMGTTESVAEDPSLIQQVKASFLEMPSSLVGPEMCHPGTVDNRSRQDVDFDTVFDAELVPAIGELDMASPNISSNGLGTDHVTEDPFLIEGIDRAVSQVQSWHFVDGEFSNGWGTHCSMNSSDCISQTVVEPAKVVSAVKREKVNSCCNHGEGGPADPQSNDLHYQNVISSLLKSHHQLIFGPHFQQGRRHSCFANWKKEGIQILQKPRSATPQMVLKKILFEVPRKHDLGFLEENSKRDGALRPESDHICPTHLLSERAQSAMISERFYALKTIVPSIGNVDEVALLDDTIDYLKELKRRVDELESIKGQPDASVERSRTVERTTSDNSGHIKSGFSRSPSRSKRKARDADGEEVQEIEQRGSCSTGKNLTVRIRGKDVEMEIRCEWREGLFLEIMEALGGLRLDSQSVQSSNADGIVKLKISSKFRGSATVSTGTVRQALQRVIQRS